MKQFQKYQLEKHNFMESISSKPGIQVSGNLYAGNTLLFSDIFLLFPDCFHHISPQFKNDYRIVHYSDSGFYEDNKRKLRHSSMMGYADDLIDYLQNNDMRNIVYLAHSANALLAIMAAAKAPHLFNKIVLTSAAACLLPKAETQPVYDDCGSILDDLFRCILQQQTGVHLNAAVQFTDILNSAFSKITCEEARAVFQLLFTTDCRSYLNNFPVSTIILQVAADKMATYEAGYAMYRSMPDSQLVRIKAKGQLPFIEMPEEIIQAIKVFI